MEDLNAAKTSALDRLMQRIHELERKVEEQNRIIDMYRSNGVVIGEQGDRNSDDSPPLEVG